MRNDSCTKSVIILGTIISTGSVAGNLMTPLLKTEAALYDSMSTGRVDVSKWKILSFPTGDGETWTWEEPRPRFETKNGGLAVTVDPFTRKHDHVHMV